MSRPVPKPPALESLPLVHRQAAGLDIGSAEIWAAVPEACDPTPVRRFATFTSDLHDLAHWLQRCGVTTVAMESTGVYWIPIYEILSAGGMAVYLVNARHLKHVPGRKSDVQDCQWIQRLHSFGLLNASFRPEEEMVVLRAYLRQRADLIQHRAAHIQHMQKALQQMNLQLVRVLADITGQTGLQIIRAVVGGEHDPQVLAQYRDRKCKHAPAEFVKAMTGHYRAEHLFALKQALSLYDAYSAQIAECDQAVERQFSALKPLPDPPQPRPPLDPSDKANTHSKNAPPYDARRLLYEALAVDLVALAGLHSSSVQVLISEVGRTLARFPTSKHFCAWLHLAPRSEISGGKVLRSRTLKARNRAGEVFRLAAQSVGRTQTEYGAFFRKLRAKHGVQKAIVATAHKLARAFYAMLKERKAYEARSAEAYAERERQQQLTHLSKKARALGFHLVAVPTPGTADVEVA